MVISHYFFLFAAKTVAPILRVLCQESSSVIFITKIFITIPSTDTTPKPLHAIKSERQRALAPCDQLNPRESCSKSGRKKNQTILRVHHFTGTYIRHVDWQQRRTVFIGWIACDTTLEIRIRRIPMKQPA